MTLQQTIHDYEQAGLSLPETLTIAITTACNLQCTHCWFEAGPSRAESRVPPASFYQVLDDFINLGGSSLRLTGGEPLLHPQWLVFLNYAADRNLSRIILQTNGLLFDNTSIRALSLPVFDRLQVQLSLDGACAQTHDLVRGQNSYHRTMEVLKNLVAHGLAPRLAIFFTEMQHNVQELPEVFALAARLGIASVSSGALVQCGRAGKESLVRPPEPEQYIGLLEHWQQDEVFRRNYQAMGCVAALEWCHSEGSIAQGCSFIKTPYLTSDGILYPCLMCHADSYAVDDVFSKGLEAALKEGLPLWSDLHQLSQDRVTSLPECQPCALRHTCGGGCMGRAWGSFGNFLTAEDRCRQRQAVSRWKEKTDTQS